MSEEGWIVLPHPGARPGILMETAPVQKERHKSAPAVWDQAAPELFERSPGKIIIDRLKYQTVDTRRAACHFSMNRTHSVPFNGSQKFPPAYLPAIWYDTYMETIRTIDWLQPTTEAEEKCLRDAGFRWGQRGTHTSRTIMLDELKTLLAHCQPDASLDDYAAAIIEDNCLGKRTVATRKLTLQRLSELYALDSKVLLFRVMRHFWYADRFGQTILSLLLALARDPLLRATALTILRTRPGEELARQPLIDALNRMVGNRLNESTLDKVVRNAASSWTQSGHLKGRNRKVRQRVAPNAASTAYALLLGYLTGTRGPALFEAPWTQVLDAPPDELMNLAMDARRLGFLNMSQSGGIVEVAFSRLLALDERQLGNGKN